MSKPVLNQSLYALGAVGLLALVGELEKNRAMELGLGAYGGRRGAMAKAKPKIILFGGMGRKNIALASKIERAFDVEIDRIIGADEPIPTSFPSGSVIVLITNVMGHEHYKKIKKLAKASGARVFDASTRLPELEAAFRRAGLLYGASSSRSRSRSRRRTSR